MAHGAIRIAPHVDQQERRDISALISRRETEMAEPFAFGVPTEVIAARFGLSPETVRTHRRNLLLKTDTHHQTDLIRIALGSGLIACATSCRPARIPPTLVVTPPTPITA